MMTGWRRSQEQGAHELQNLKGNYDGKVLAWLSLKTPLQVHSTQPKLLNI